jgi:hypothetical protein
MRSDAGNLVGLLEAIDDGAGTGVTLDAGGHEPGRAAPAAGLEHLDEVMPDRADLGRHERDDLRELRQRSLQFVLEQALGLQLRLQFLELLEEVALPRRLDRVDDQRELARLAVEIRLHLRDDLHAVAERRLQPARLEGIEHAVDLRLAVLQREVVVTGGIGLITRDLARHLQRPHPVQMPFQDIRQVGDGERSRIHGGRFADTCPKGKWDEGRRHPALGRAEHPCSAACLPWP